MSLRFIVSDGTREVECADATDALRAASELFPGLIVSIEPAGSRRALDAVTDADLYPLTDEDRAALTEALTAILDDLGGDAA